MASTRTNWKPKYEQAKRLLDNANNQIKRLESEKEQSEQARLKSEATQIRLKRTLESIGSTRLMKLKPNEHGGPELSGDPIGDDEAFVELCRIVGVAQGATMFTNF